MKIGKKNVHKKSANRLPIGEGRCRTCEDASAATAGSKHPSWRLELDIK